MVLGCSRNAHFRCLRSSVIIHHRIWFCFWNKKLLFFVLEFPDGKSMFQLRTNGNQTLPTAIIIIIPPFRRPIKINSGLINIGGAAIYQTSCRSRGLFSLNWEAEAQFIASKREGIHHCSLCGNCIELSYWIRSFSFNFPLLIFRLVNLLTLCLDVNFPLIINCPKNIFVFLSLTHWIVKNNFNFPYIRVCLKPLAYNFSLPLYAPSYNHK